MELYYLKWWKSFLILACDIICIFDWNNNKWTYLHILSTKKCLKLTEKHFLDLFSILHDFPSLADEIDEDLPSSKLFVMGDCRICQLCKVEILILPCKHRACGDCAHGVTGCPVCNKPIAEQRDVWAQDNLWQEMVVGYMEEEYEMYDNMAEWWVETNSITIINVLQDTFPHLIDLILENMQRVYGSVIYQCMNSELNWDMYLIALHDLNLCATRDRFYRHTD